MGIYRPSIFKQIFLISLTVVFSMTKNDSDNVIIFGCTSSKSRIHSSIEFAFETLRKDLSRHMELIAETTAKLDYTENTMTDIKLADKLRKLHRIYRNQVASIPSLWETNEETLRWLINPNELKVTVAINHSPSKVNNLLNLIKSFQLCFSSFDLSVYVKVRL